MTDRERVITGGTPEGELRYALGLEQKAFMHSVLPELSGEQCYVFGLLMYERLLEVAKRTMPDGLGLPKVAFDRVDAVLEALWARLPDEPSSSSISGATLGWYYPDPSQGELVILVATMPDHFNGVRISWRDTVTQVVQSLWQGITGAFPQPRLAAAEFAAERAELIGLRDGVPYNELRAMAREAARGLAER